MCGIAGILSFNYTFIAGEYKTHLQRMVTRIARRGLDDEGIWVDPAGRVGFGFRRLSVLDLSPAGHQPMVSPDGRSALVFNGEIYNFKEIRAELESKGQFFRSRSDSEVLLYALETWGTDAIPRLNGMFAFAWYHTHSRTLLLARDHAGIKPLYYALHPGKQGLVFASQYDQLLLGPWGKPDEVRLDVLNLYLRLHHIPPPYGLLENTYQLEPGHYLKVDAGGNVENHTWWQLPRSPNSDLRGSAAVDAAEQALEPISTITVRWLIENLYLFSQAEAIGDKLVYYEDLIKDPSDRIRSLCSDLGLVVENDLEDKVNKPSYTTHPRSPIKTSSPDKQTWQERLQVAEVNKIYNILKSVDFVYPREQN